MKQASMIIKNNKLGKGEQNNNITEKEKEYLRISFSERF